MMKLSNTFFISFVNAKASCKLLRDVECERVVLRRLAITQISPFQEDNFFVERILNLACVAKNMKAIFVLDLFTFLCWRGFYVWLSILWYHLGCTSQSK